MKWFRLYTETLNDPKIQRLTPELFRYWINVLCIASEHDGALPPLVDIAFSLRLTEEQCLLQVIEPLCAASLIDRRGTGMKPHNWDKRQYKSDVSTDRVKRFRKRTRNVTTTLPETPPETDTESETDTEQNRAEGERVAFGEHAHAVMTRGEHRKLREKLNSHLDDFISQFDNWVHEAPDAKHQGVKRRDRDPYASICQWYARAVKEGKVKPSKNSVPSEEELERERLLQFGPRRKTL
jgi:hypothetical protein